MKRKLASFLVSNDLLIKLEELGEINDDLIPYKITQSSEKKKVKREIKNVEGISKTTIKQQNCGSNIKNNNKADSDKLKPNK